MKIGHWPSGFTTPDNVPKKDLFFNHVTRSECKFSINYGFSSISTFDTPELIEMLHLNFGELHNCSKNVIMVNNKCKPDCWRFRFEVQAP